MTRPRLGPGVLAILAVTLAAGALLAGCGVKGTLVPNLPPETVVFVSGPVDTLNHVVHLRWFGSDPDGSVSRFDFRWVYPAGQGPAGYDSSLWIPTTRTDSTFTLYAPTGYTMPTFVVRAVDNQGLPDPTPARETFQFKNQPPVVHLTNLPLPRTFPGRRATRTGTSRRRRTSSGSTAMRRARRSSRPRTSTRSRPPRSPTGPAAT
jgi:predicted small lipoprotein YifL